MFKTYEERLAELEQHRMLLQTRMQRDDALIRSDVAVLRAYEAGVPVSAEWVAYRQALRDIPQQPGFPDSIQWPTKPE
jgi:hypothetical protein